MLNSPQLAKQSRERKRGAGNKKHMTDQEKSKLKADVAARRAAMTLPDDAALKAKALATAKEIKASATSGKLALLVLIRVLGESKCNLANLADRMAINAWLRADGHGLGCNASQFGQWVNGGSKTASEEEELMG